MDNIFEKIPQGEKEESLEERIKRLRPIFKESLGIFRNRKKDPWEGAITVSRRRSDGTVELINDLVCIGINEDGPDLAWIAWIDDEGKPTASATMGWEEIIDVKI